MALAGFGLLLFPSVLAVGAGPSDVDLRPSQMAPLAATSLVLDAARAGDRLIAVGERGHVLRSDDDGRSWRQETFPVRSTLTALAFHDDRTGWAVGHDAVILYTGDGGETWTLQHADPEAEQPLLDVVVVDRQRVIAIGAYGLYLETDDGGATWTRRSVLPEDSHLNGIAVAGADDTMVADANGTGNVPLVMAGEFGSLLRSDDAGVDWVPLPSPYDGSFFGILALSADELMAFGLQGNLFRSDDGGKRWTPVNSGTTAGLMGGAVLRDGRIVIVGLAGTVLVSDDRGRRFRLIRRADRMALSGVVEAADGAVVLVGEQGPLRITGPLDAMPAATGADG